jgi:hypothetical protein
MTKRRLEKHVVGEESKRCDGTPHSAVVKGDLELVESPLWMGVVRVWWCGGVVMVSAAAAAATATAVVVVAVVLAVCDSGVRRYRSTARGGGVRGTH